MEKKEDKKEPKPAPKTPAPAKKPVPAPKAAPAPAPAPKAAPAPAAPAAAAPAPVKCPHADKLRQRAKNQEEKSKSATDPLQAKAHLAKSKSFEEKAKQA